METVTTIPAMLAENDKQQAVYQAKATLCAHALQTFEACKHYKNVDKKMCTRHDTDFPGEYLRLDTEYTPKVTLYSRELTYNEQISFYLPAHTPATWSSLIEVATKAKADYERYAIELETEKSLYTAVSAIEEKIKILQDEADAMKLSGTSAKFFPRSHCSKCRYC